MDPDPNAPIVAAPVVAAPTPDVIAAAVQAGLQAHQASVQSAPKEMTPEERAQYLQVFDPNQDGFVDSFVAAITDAEATPEVRTKAINHLRDGVVNQALRGAELLLEQRMSALEQRFQPVLATSVEQQAKQMWEDFTTKHPDLKDHQNLVNLVSTQIQQSGYKPASLEDAYNRTADATRELIATTTGKPYVKPVVTQAEPKTTMPRMSQTNTTASAGNPSPNAGKPVGVASFFLKRSK